jgi:cell shape-determining protein MreD
MRLFFLILNPCIYLLIAALGIAIQTTLFTNTYLEWVAPMIPLWVVVWLAKDRPLELTGCMSLIIGRICEIHSAAPMGLYAFAFIVIIFVVRLLCRFAVIQPRFFFVTLTCISWILFKSILFLSLLVFRVNTPLFIIFFLSCLVGSIFNGFFALWGELVFARLDQFIDVKNEQGY